MCYNRIQFFFVSLQTRHSCGSDGLLPRKCWRWSSHSGVSAATMRGLPHGIGRLASMYAEENVSTIDRRYDK